MIQNKAQGLPINILVMLIIGVIIFGLGIALFSKISNYGNDEMDKLNDQIRDNINSLECDGEEWICSPNYKMKNGETQTFQIYIANRGDESANFDIDFGSSTESKVITKSGCGSVTMVFSPTVLNNINIFSGKSAARPFIIKANKVSDTPCSFVTTATLTKDGDSSFSEKTTIIIRVE